MSLPKLIRITTVPISLKVLLKGQHKYMSDKGFEVVGVSSSGKELKQVEAEEGIRVEVVKMTRTISLLKDLISLWAFYRFCKKEKPTIVHSHTPKAGIVGMLGAKMAGVPIRMHTVAGLPLMEATGIKRRLLNFVEKLTYWAATNVYPNSEGLYKFILQEKFTSSNKLKLIAKGSSNGIDTTFFSLDKISEIYKKELKVQLGINENDFVFVFVGRLVGDKGVNELVNAFVRMPSLNVKLLLVGAMESDLDPLLEETTQKIENDERITAVGFQEDVRTYLAVSNVLVFPSYREGFPNVVMQAGSMGLPAIVSDINGCNEIIVDNVNGVIVPPKNEEAIRSTMLQVLNDASLYQHMRSNATSMIKDRYEQIKVWEALLEEYNRLTVNKQKV